MTLFVRKHFQVHPNFFVQLRVTVRSTKQADQTSQDYAQRHHGLCSSNRLIMATVRSQLSVSAASCFRPARVIE
jgi:hypothetical protein